MALSRDFAAQVNLPCRIHYGPKASLELNGTARRMDARALTLRLGPGHQEWMPVPSEPVLLDISLPGDGAKMLRIRGRVGEVHGLENGAREVEVYFRKAVFRDAKKTPRPSPQTGMVM